MSDDDLAARYAWPEHAETRRVVRANMVTSLDGGGALDGRTAGLSSPADERRFAILRDLADVLLVGAGTVRAERYGGVRLDEHRAARRRRWGFAGPPPIAVVTRGGLSGDLPIFTDTEVPPIVITTRRGADTVPSGAETIVAGDARARNDAAGSDTARSNGAGDDAIDLRAALDALEERGLRKISCEGGPGLLADLVAAGLLDELCLTVSPVLLGASSVRLLAGDLPAPSRWTLVGVDTADQQLFARYRRDDP